MEVVTPKKSIFYDGMYIPYNATDFEKFEKEKENFLGGQFTLNLIWGIFDPPGKNELWHVFSEW